jgi:hypothetical protein
VSTRRRRTVARTVKAPLSGSIESGSTPLDRSGLEEAKPLLPANASPEGDMACRRTIFAEDIAATPECLKRFHVANVLGARASDCEILVATKFMHAAHA